MSRSLNKVMLIGNVGNSPNLKHTPSGIPVTSFRLATTNTRKDRDGNFIDSTDWHSVVAWRHLAQIINQIVNRGSRVYVEGKLQTRELTDENGNRKEFTEVVAEQVILLDSREKRRRYEEDNIDSSDEDSSSDDYSYEYEENNDSDNSDDYDSEYGDGYTPNPSKSAPF